MSRTPARRPESSCSPRITATRTPSRSACFIWARSPRSVVSPTARRPAVRRRSSRRNASCSAGVPTAATKTSRPAARVAVDLCSRAGVVVQPAHNERIHGVRNTEKAKALLHFLKVRAALVAQVVRDAGSAFNNPVTCRFFALQDAQRVPLQPALTISAKLVAVRSEVLAQGLDVPWRTGTSGRCRTGARVAAMRPCHARDMSGRRRQSPPGAG